ncbi:MAG: YbhN family protein [Nitrososphaerales archaeon]
MKWRIIAIAASLIPLVIIALLLDVGPADIIAVGIFPFALASAAAIGKLVVQGFRFHYFIKSFVGPVASLRNSILARFGSEFITLTTPAYTGGEFLRVAWLHKKGVHAGKGMWVITVEVINDVMMGGTLSYVAAIWAFFAGNYLIATGIVVIVSPIFAAYLALLVLSSKRILQLPKFMTPLIGKFVGITRAERMTGSANEILKGLCEMSRENLRASSIKIFVTGFILSFIGASLHALTFLILANTMATVGFFESLMAVSASVAIGTLPISPGGSGLSEFGIGAYLATFGIDVLAFGSIIIAWRIASYHVALVVAWIALMKLAVSKLDSTTTPTP